MTLRTYPSTILAEVPRLRLEAEGIPTFLDGARMGDNSLYQVATGGVKLRVPRELVQEARILLSQSWAVPFPEDEEDWEDDADEDDHRGENVVVPTAGSWWQRELLAIILVFTLALVILTLILGIDRR